MESSPYPARPLRRRLVDRLAAPAALSAVLLPLLLLLVFLSPLQIPDIAADGDGALLELNTREALAGGRLLGPYSRFHFNHPGPAYFWVMAPLYMLLGEAHGSLALTALVVNIACLGLLFRILYQGTGLLLLPATLLAWLVAGLGMPSLYSHWNPTVTRLPFVLALFCLAAVASGRRAYLPLAALAGSFAVQSHLGYLPLVLALGMTALLIPFLARTKAAGKALSGPGFLTAVSLAVVWAPPAFEQWSQSPGNVSRIVTFLGLPHETPTLAQAASFTAQNMSSFLVAPFFGVESQTAAGPVVSVVLILLLPPAFLAARRKGADFLGALCLLALVGAGASVLAVSRIVGGTHPYLAGWMPGLGLAAGMGVGGVGWMLLQQRTGRYARTGALLLALALAGCMVHSLGQVGVSEHWTSWIEYSHRQETRQLTSQLAESLDRLGIQEPRLVVARAQDWKVASGIVLAMDKIGRWMCADESWLFLFGRSRACRGRLDSTVVLVDAGSLHFFSGDPRFESVAQSGQFSLFLARSLPLTGRVQFAGLDSLLYLEEGFARLETLGTTPGRWSKGDRASMALVLRPAHSYDARLQLAPFRVEKRHQKLTVRLNGHLLARLWLAPEEQEYSLRLPGTLVEGYNRLSFEYAYTARPLEHRRDSPDSRLLGVHFRRLILTPTGGPEAAESTPLAPRAPVRSP